MLAVTLAALISAALAVLLLRPLLAPKPPQELHIAFTFSDPLLDDIEKQLRHYQNITPDIELILHSVSSAAAAEELPVDIMFNYGHLSDAARQSFSAGHLWTGNIWTLAVHAELLDEETLEALLRTDNLSEFGDILQAIQESGIVPLAVGNSHLWPLGIWEQHVSLSLAGDPVYRYPAPAVLGGTPLPGWELLREWVREGYFLEEYWGQGWARGLQAAADGRAAMVLMSDRMRTSIPRLEFEKFVFRPFPQGNSALPWAVGNGIFIYQRINPEESGAVARLSDYLTSDAVTAALGASTRQTFFSSSRNSAAIFVPSWEKLANEPFFRSYARSLNDFVRPSGD